MVKRILIVVGGLLALIVAVPAYVSVMAAPLHPQPQSAPSITRSAPAPQWADAVDRSRQIVRAALADQNLPGLSVAVGVDGDLVWAEGFGWADIKTGAPVTPDTRFWIGTASTVLTAVGAGVLLEQSQLTLDENIRAYGTGTRNDGPQFQQRCERPLDKVSAAIEDAAEQPFLTFMQKRVFQPLRMSHTGADSAKEENPDAIGEPAEDPPPLTLLHDLILEPLGVVRSDVRQRDRATFYAKGWGPHPIVRYGLHVTHPRNLSCYAGSMAFLSTPSDLVRFNRAINSRELLRPSTVQSLQSLQQPTYDGELLGGKVMSLTTIRERGIVVVVMANVSYANTSALAQKVAAEFR